MCVCVRVYVRDALGTFIAQIRQCETKNQNKKKVLKKRTRETAAACGFFFSFPDPQTFFYPSSTRHPHPQYNLFFPTPCAWWRVSWRFCTIQKQKTIAQKNLLKEKKTKASTLQTSIFSSLTRACATAVCVCASLLSRPVNPKRVGRC